MREKEGDLESGIARADISQNAQHFLIVRLFIYEYSLVDVDTSQRRTNRFLGSADITSVKSIKLQDNSELQLKFTNVLLLSNWRTEGWGAVW